MKELFAMNRDIHDHIENFEASEKISLYWTY